MSSQEIHRSVLLDETIDWWCPQASADQAYTYVDCTFGRGGHSRALLERAPHAKVVVFDKDPAAIQEAKALQVEFGVERISIAHSSFAQIKDVLAELGLVGHIRGVLMDLGVSSPQLDEAQRGFSFLRDGPLDMRMDSSTGETAAQWLAKVDEKQLANVIYRFGEEKQSRRIAKKIVEARSQNPIETTAQLADLVCKVVPRRGAGKHPATRTFQAIRMFINAELEDLELGLSMAFEVLEAHGRLVVLSFHSLEDRIVKHYMQKQSKPADLPRGLPIKAEEIAPPAKVCVKGLKPTDVEVHANPRARSALLRVLERCE